MAADVADIRGTGIDGRQAWTVAVAVGVVAGVGFGTAYSFGAFFKEMAADLDASRSATAVVFGTTILLFFGLGVVTGPLSDRYGPRRLLVAAAILMSTGLALTARVQHLWVGYLTYGIGVGVGAGLYITPCFAVVGGWFERKRAMALGVASAGGGVGTLVLVPAANRLIEAYGWRRAYEILAIAVGVTLLAASRVIARPPVPAPPPGDHRVDDATRSRPFQLLFAGALLMSVALFVAFAFIVPFAEDQGISSSAAAALVAVVGASSVAGRLALSGLTRRLGALRLYQLCIAIQPLAYVIWLVAGSRYGLLVAFAIVLGVSYGGFVALGPTVTADIFGVVGLGALLGRLYLGGGLGGFVGPPLAGYLNDQSGGQALPIAVALAVTIVAAAVSAMIPSTALRLGRT